MSRKTQKGMRLLVAAGAALVLGAPEVSADVSYQSPDAQAAEIQAARPSSVSFRSADAIAAEIEASRSERGPVSYQSADAQSAEILASRSKSAPVTKPAPVSYQSPDAQAAEIEAGRSEAGPVSYQSADAQAAEIEAGRPQLDTAPADRRPVDTTGFDWTLAGIGAAGLLVALTAVTAMSLVALRRRDRSVPGSAPAVTR